MPPTTALSHTLRSLSRYTPRTIISSPVCVRSLAFPPRASLSSLQRLSKRYTSTQQPLTDSPIPKASSHKPHAPKTRPPQPEYEMTFTCKPCGTRSSHRVSKHGYHYGSVLITCPDCRNRHVISDHLNIFGDKHMTIEDLMREQGQLVKKGTLSEDGDLEFWEDGSTTKRAKTNESLTAGEGSPKSLG